MITEHTKHTFDVMSIGTIFATIAGWLPAIAAALSIVWTVIRIYETKTVQSFLRGDDAKSDEETDR